MKQKDWMKENHPDKMYKDDYKMALFMHSFSWSFMVLLVPTIYLLYINLFDIGLYLFSFIFNLIGHCVVDNMKANKKYINLIQDQLYHMAQIISIWALLLF